MAVHATEARSEHTDWRPRPLAILLIALADFVGAVGLGNLLLGESAAGWLAGSAALLLTGIAASG
jgi:hypothetical protein